MVIQLFALISFFLLLPYAVLPLRFQLSCGMSVKYRFIEFFVFNYGSLPYLLSLLFRSGVSLDKISLAIMISLSNFKLSLLLHRNYCDILSDLIFNLLGLSVIPS